MGSNKWSEYSFAMEKPWYWEGNVQSSLARHLRIAGWTLTSAADTASKEQGTDLVLSKGDRTLLIEVKGFPTTVYESGPLVGQPKPTVPIRKRANGLATPR